MGSPRPRDSGDLTPGSWNLPPEVQLRRALTPWGEGETRGGRGGGSPAARHRAKSIPGLCPGERGWRAPKDCPRKGSEGPGALCPSPRKDGRQLPRRSAGPGLAVLGVPMATLSPQRRALGLGQRRRQRGQVAGGAGEQATPAGLGGALQTEPCAAPPPRARCPAHAVRPHQQAVARVALEVLLPADGAVILTCGKRGRCGGGSQPQGTPVRPSSRAPWKAWGPRSTSPAAPVVTEDRSLWPQTRSRPGRF